MQDEVVKVAWGVDEVGDFERVTLVCRPEELGMVICNYSSLGEESVEQCWSRSEVNLI